MKIFAAVLVLLTLALAPSVQCLAGAPATPAMPATPAAGIDDFLATLSAGQDGAPDLDSLSPEPRFLTTTCTDDSECPPGYKCCYPCGIDGCDFVCMQVQGPRCPFFP